MPDYSTTTTTTKNIAGSSKLPPGIKNEKRQNNQKETKTETKCAQGSGRVPRKKMLFTGGTVSPMIFAADRLQSDAKKASQKTFQGKGRDEAKKNKSRPRRGSGFSLNLYFLVFRGDPVWYCMIFRDISRYHAPNMRYYMIRYIEIEYPHPEFWGLTSRYRIPSIYLSLPTTSTRVNQDDCGVLHV